MENGTPTLDRRKAVQVLEELLLRRPAYVPELVPAPGGATSTLLQIFARYMEVVIDRLNQAPDKNLLAFLEMLGINLLPAQAARAPVVFQPLPNADNGRIVARTRVGAEVPERATPVMFETESAIALAAARLVEVVSLWPARDAYADHTPAAIGGRPFQLFKPPQPVPHEIYLAHDTLLAFGSGAVVEIEFELSTPGSVPLKIAWEYWDGQVWRPFKPFDRTDRASSQDGTTGLTRSGVVTLRAECGQSAKKQILGLDAYWVRGRLEQPLPSDPARVLPEVDRIRLRTVQEQPLRYDPPGSMCVGDIKPDQAFASGSQLDLSKTFFPFGQSPDNDSVFYFTSSEVLSKPGAAVTLCYTRVVTPEEEADNKSKEYELDINTARQLILQAAGRAAFSVSSAAESILALATASPEKIQFQQKLAALTIKINNLTELTDIAGLAGAASEVEQASNVPVDVVRSPVSGSLSAVQVDVQSTLSNMTTARMNAAQAMARAVTVLNALSQLNPIDAAAVGGTLPPVLSEARLVWEYWNGQRWQALTVSGNNNAGHFLHLPSGQSDPREITFVVPHDLEPTSTNGVTARWLRVRLTAGSYNRLRLVSWYDTASKITNFFPIVESRPPALADLFLGYTYRSAWTYPEHCLTYSDFQWELHSGDVRVPGRFFPPFRAVADATPALYLGFDQPLPNDLVSVYLDIKESDVTTPPLVWEAWDGTTWREVSVNDETAGLQRPGMVSFIAPDVASRPLATVVQATGMQINTGSAIEAARFQPDDRVVVRQDETQELASVQKIHGATIWLETPLANTYSGDTVELAALPRFGTPHEWVRARLKQDGAPAESWINGLYLNAAWVAQRDTINDEVLGSGTEQPRQTVFFRQVPVLPGEQIEVRELEGARAAVELPILQEELLQHGLTAEDIRTVSDARTGRVTEVWVRWQPRPHLFFSGPEDRHYMVDRARGRLLFGDGRYGRLPTVGANNIRARQYQAGGGLVGNVPAGQITQLLSPAPFVESVTNPRAADGGAEGETLAAVKTRGPQTLRHRGRALAARDYEALAREASPGVAVARALPATAPNGRPAPGWVTVIIVPQSQEAQPQPSYELRRQVHRYLVARTPATVTTARIAVIGPGYLPIGVAATVAPREASEAGAVEHRVHTTLMTFLHPLTGGPEGQGWPFGRHVYLSDVAAVLEAVNGVDYVTHLSLLLNDTPQDERVAVPPDRMVVAGPLHIELQEAEC